MKRKADEAGRICKSARRTAATALRQPASRASRVAAVHRRLERLHRAAHRRRLLERAEQAAADAGQHRRAERGRLDEGGPLDRQVEHVGQILRQPVVGRHAAVDLEPLPGARRRRRRRSSDRGSGAPSPPARRGRYGRGRWRSSGPMIAAARVGPPVRRAEPGQGRHQIDAATVGHRARQRLALGGAGDQAELVAQPLDQAAGDEHRAFQRVARARRRAARRSWSSRRLRETGALVAGMGEDEGAGAVGRLGVAAARGRPGRSPPPAGRRPCRRSGSAPPNRSGRSRRSRPAQSTISGSAAARHAEQVEQARRPSGPCRMSIKAVREALVASETCSPPVSLKTSQLSTVPTHEIRRRPRAAAASSPSPRRSCCALK